MQKWRLGLDVGTNSIGWAVFGLNDSNRPHEIIDLGSRIFSDGRDPKTKEPLAVARRGARSARRRRDRYISRRHRLMKLLVEYGLMPQSKEERKKLEGLNPYGLRTKALDHPLLPHELGRVFFHMNQRRGFASSRKDDNDETSKFKDKIKKLQTQIYEENQARTLGEYLYKRLQENKPTRFRDIEDIYPDRMMLRHEFDEIKKRQKDHLTDDQWEMIDYTIFHQRPLKEQEKGKCIFFPAEDRAHKQLPSSELFRLLQDVNNLKLVMQDLSKMPLTEPQRLAVFEKLKTSKSSKFSALLNLKDSKSRQRLFSEDVRFNFESEIRDKLEGLSTSLDLEKEECFGKKWQALILPEQDEVVKFLIEEPDPEKCIQRLISQYGLSLDQAQKTSKHPFKKQNAYSSMSVKALNLFIPHLLEGKRYDEVKTILGLSESTNADGEIFDELPYYGEVLEGSTMGRKSNPKNIEEEFGKIANPTVHIGLNQIRYVVNHLIKKYGHPEEIIIEMGRELKQSLEKKMEHNKKNKQNKDINDQAAKEIKEQGHRVNRDNLIRWKLWYELKQEGLSRLCIFTGEPISATQVLTDEVEVEHLIPFGRSFDDSFMNKTLCKRKANRIKEKRSPFEARHDFEKNGWRWQDILDRAAGLPKAKELKFSEEATKDAEGKEKDFIARQTTDNAYLARVAKRYLSKVCHPDKIWVTPGRLTALLRHHWGLNSILDPRDLGEDEVLKAKKNRDDHRHHAIDAVVIGLTDRGLLQSIAKQSGNGKDDFYKIAIPSPWNSLRYEVDEKIKKMIVSHKPDHGFQGRFFKDTAYGFVKAITPKDEKAEELFAKDYNLVVKQSIGWFDSPKKLEQIRDKVLREDLIKSVQHLMIAKGKKEGFSDEKLAIEIIQKKAQAKNIKSIRTLIKQDGVEKIPDSPYKGYAKDGFLYVDIWEIPSKKGNPKWEGVFKSLYDASLEKSGKLIVDHNKIKPHPAAKKIMRLYRDDLLKIDHDNEEIIVKVYLFSTTNNMIGLTRHTTVKSGEDFKSYFSINGLKDKNPKKIRMSSIGKI